MGHRSNRRAGYSTRRHNRGERVRKGLSWDTPEGREAETLDHPNHGEIGSTFCAICNPKGAETL